MKHDAVSINLLCKMFFCLIQSKIQANFEISRNIFFTSVKGLRKVCFCIHFRFGRTSFIHFSSGLYSSWKDTVTFRPSFCNKNAWTAQKLFCYKKCTVKKKNCRTTLMYFSGKRIRVLNGDCSQLGCFQFIMIQSYCLLKIVALN